MIVVGPGQAAAVAMPQGDQEQTREPRPPKFPKNFKGTGRYFGPSLGVNVPSKWNAKNGDAQMVAGGKNHPIWFTNVIYRGNFYTYTYKWPGIPLVPCNAPVPFGLDVWNKVFKEAHDVVPVILQGRTWGQVLHFGIHDFYAPDYDEWITMTSWERKPGKVSLPRECGGP